MTAVYTYDFADRAASLSLEGNLAQTVVSSAAYEPFGPLADLALGNGLVEQRRFDGRYSPTRIEVPGLLDAVYTTDGVGNVLSIDRDGLAASFTYQDVDYFLSGTSGPWPSRSWTYDRIGNRLTEDTATLPPVPPTSAGATSVGRALRSGLSFCLSCHAFLPFDGRGMTGSTPTTAPAVPVGYVSPGGLFTPFGSEPP